MLRPGAALAILGNAMAIDEAPVRRDLDAVYARLAPSVGGARVSPWYQPGGPIPGLFAESGRFGPVASRRVPWSRRYATADYLGLLGTHSDHLLLPEQERARLFEGVAETLARHGEGIEVSYDANLYVARRKGDASP